MCFYLKSSSTAVCVSWYLNCRFCVSVLCKVSMSVCICGVGCCRRKRNKGKEEKEQGVSLEEEEEEVSEEI